MIRQTALKLSMLGAMSLALAACDAVPQQQNAALVEARNGQNIYSFIVQEKATTIGYQNALNAQVKTRAAQFCPRGYQELSRKDGGMIVRSDKGLPVRWYKTVVEVSCKA
ncbi:hypothetical protein [Paracoccus aminophilus]|nr:hypothetical protein [Paracoccus aminophilus]